MKINPVYGLSLALCGAVACGTDPTLDARSDNAEIAPESLLAETTATSSTLTLSNDRVANTAPGGDVLALSGTCADPIEIRRDGVFFGSGNATFWRGTTEGMPNALHPRGRCVANDSREVVFRYVVPQGVQAVEVSTEGSRMDTVVYARTSCEQSSGDYDLVCNDNSYENAPQSKIFLTNLTPGQSVFLVVDGNADSEQSTGSFVLSVRDVPYGESGFPCHAERPNAARCSLRLRCSEGGSADGSDICAPTVVTGRGCDPRGFSNVCSEGDSCVIEAGGEAVPTGPVCRPSRLPR